MKISIKENFFIRDLAGEKVLIGSGNQINLSRMLIINGTTAFIIQELQKGQKTLEELTNSMIEIYETTYTEALKDVEELVIQLEELDVVTIEDKTC